MSVCIDSFPTLPLNNHLNLPDAAARYDHGAYDSLPSLHLASERFQQLDAITAVVSPIRDLFLKHKVHKHLGIALLHKHFPIRPTERLVDCRNISAPWDIGDDTDAVIRKYESLILPRSFRLVQEKLVPYEFDFSDADSPRHMDQAFLSELSSLLYQHRSPGS